MSYTRAYLEVMKPEKRVARTSIRPLRIYRVSTYKTGDPITKTGEQARWIFVIGKVGDRIHSIRLNDIKPQTLMKFLNTIRDKRIPIGHKSISRLLYKFSLQGRDLFEKHIKPNPSVYLPNTKSSYRIYILEKIVHVWEIRFTDGFLKELFGEKDDPTTTTQQADIIQDEINERDGGDE